VCSNIVKYYAINSTQIFLKLNINTNERISSDDNYFKMIVVQEVHKDKTYVKNKSNKLSSLET